MNPLCTTSSLLQGVLVATGLVTCTVKASPASYCRGTFSSSSSSSALPLMWYFYSFAALLWCCFLPCLCVGATDSPATTTYSPKPPVFNLADCRQSFDSVDQTIYICGKHPELFPILKYAEQVAKRKCEEDFKNHIWNCSGFSLLRQPLLTGGNKVFNESAYVYALSLAVIAHTVAKGCAQNVIDCSCAHGNPGFNAAACSDNVEYGLQIAEKFLNKRYTASGGGLKQTLAQHNFHAARNIIQHVMNATGKTCHCHGISGSCTFSTCRSELPTFEILALRLKQAYQESCRVSANGHSDNKWVSRCGRQVTTMDLIHRDVNNWCEPDHTTGGLGVVGRECSPYPGDPDSCSKLCGSCGKDSREYSVTEESSCNCRFHFCCEIRCDKCAQERTYFRCS